jgi:hypothetical protein
MKKLVSLVLALIMTTALLTVGANAWDDDEKNRYLDDCKKLTTEEYKVFYANFGPNKESFQPAGKLTRGYGCRIGTYLALGMKDANALPKVASFSDVTDATTYCAHIKWCMDKGIVSGYGDGTYAPTKNLSRDAFLKIVLGALGYKAEEQGYNKAETWRWEVLSDAQAIGLLNGVEISNVVEIRRDEAAKIVVNALMATPVGGTEPLYKTVYPALLG